MTSRSAAVVGRLLLAMSLVLATSGTARADGLFTPFWGWDFGGDAGDCRSLTPCDPKQTTFGGSLAFMIGGIFGLEGDFGYAPHFFGEGNALSDNHVLTFMGNLLVGAPIGPVRPYAVGGIGVLHTDISASTAGLYNAFTNNAIAYDLGGGLMVFFSNHVGVRGDLRYVRTFDKIEFAPLQLNNKALQFGRGTIGLTLRF
jgi:opacity protein-like surface antigen